MSTSPVEGRRIEVRGTVQGVGFRPWVYRLAVEEGLSGRVRNDARGVTIEAFGLPEALDAFRRRLGAEAPPAARLREVREEPIPAEPLAGFAIVASDGEGGAARLDPPDLATCPECLREVFDPADRRHRYPFTNCTHCGPRYTIARDVPYDRPRDHDGRLRDVPATAGASTRTRSTGASTPSPIACPACGPRLRARGRAAGAAVGASRRRARGGRRGACARGGSSRSRASAATTSPATPRRPRRSAGSASARSATRSRSRSWCATSTRRERWRGLDARGGAPARLGRAPDRPGAAARRRRPRARGRARQPPGRAAPRLHAAAPPAASRRRAGPLVMTSGNLSEEPMAAEDDEALARLAGIADLFLAHDRAIENRCDDSVARVIAGRPTVLRRSRGYVPRAVRAAPARAAAGPRLRGAPQEHVLPGGRRRGLAGPAHRRPRQPRGHAAPSRSRSSGCSASSGSGPRWSPTTCTRTTPRPATRSRRPEAGRRWRCSTTTPTWRAPWRSTASTGPVLGLAWDGTGLRDGRDGLGRRAAPRHVEGASSGWRRCARCASPAATRRSGRSGGSRSPRSTTPSTARRPSSGCALFDAVSRPRRGGRAADGREGRCARPSPTAPAATSTRSGRSASRRPRATYEGQVALEWNLAADEGEAGVLSLRAGGGRRPGRRPTCGRWCARRSRTSSAGRRAGRVSARFHETLARRGGGARAARPPVPGIGRAAGRPDRGLLPERPRLAEGVLRRRLRGASFDVRLGTARCRRATAGSPSARRLVADAVAAAVASRCRGRRDGAGKGRLSHVPGGAGEGRRDHGRRRAAHGAGGLLRRAAPGLPRLRARGAARRLRARARGLRHLADRRAGGARDAAGARRDRSAGGAEAPGGPERGSAGPGSEP